MTTRIGFYLFIGLVAGAIIGNWLPYVATFEALAGGIIAALIGGLIDFIVSRKNAKKEL